MIPQLTIQFFPRTQEGQSLIANQKVFMLGGKLYQGYQGSIIEVREKQLTDSEIEEAYDVDNSTEKVLGERRARLESREYRKREELAKREAIKRAEKRDQLELQKLERELGAGGNGSGHEVVSRSVARRAESQEAPAPPTDEQLAYQCKVCGKMPQDNGKSAKRWLHTHTLGAHKNPKRK